PVKLRIDARSYSASLSPRLSMARGGKRRKPARRTRLDPLPLWERVPSESEAGEGNCKRQPPHPARARIPSARATLSHRGERESAYAARFANHPVPPIYAATK